MTAELTSTTQGQTMILTLSNPMFHNALEPQMFAAGVEALSAAESNPEVRSVIITGRGSDFCAGGNLHQLQKTRDAPAAVQAQHIEGLHSWIEAIRTCQKPVLAAVEGAAAGGGFSLALACDFIVAARNAKFTMAYARIALSPDGGGSWQLVRSLPRQLAGELLMLGDRIAAQRLHELGIVNLVCEPEAALMEALQLAKRLDALAPNALASIKELLNDAQTIEFTQHLGAERDQFVKNMRHANAGIAIDAFLGKSTPHFD